MILLIDSNSIRAFVELIILSILNAKDMYGYEISKDITEKANNKFVLNEATLYAVLNRLERKHAIKSYDGKITHGKQRKYYHITKYGKLYLIELKQNYDDTTKLMNVFLEEK